MAKIASRLFRCGGCEKHHYTSGVGYMTLCDCGYNLYFQVYGFPQED